MELPNKEVLEIFRRLALPLPKEAVQKTTKEQTKKAYNTTGFGSQWLVNRFNEVLANAWGYSQKVIKEIEGKYANGTTYYNIVIETSIWVLSPSETRSMAGGHRSSVYEDALKGAQTNSFKKTAAMFGVGWEAFAGTIDDDAAYDGDIADTTKKPETVKTEAKKPEVKQEPKSEPKPEPKKETKPKTESKQDQVEQKKEPAQEKLPETGTQDVPFKDKNGRDPLTFEQVKTKMATAENVFKLNARCKKYRPDYDLLDKEHQTFIKVERDKRKVWLTLGEGNYTDVETKGINMESK